MASGSSPISARSPRRAIVAVALLARFSSSTSGAQRGVLLVPGHQASDARPPACTRGTAGSGPASRWAIWAGVAPAPSRSRSAADSERVPGQRRAGRLHELPIEGEEVELVAGLHQGQQLVFGRDLAVRAPAVAGRRPGEPRPGQRGEGAGIEPPEQHLVRGVVARRREGPERRVDGRPHRRIAGDVAMGPGAVTHEARGVGQEETAPADDRSHRAAGGRTAAASFMRPSPRARRRANAPAALRSWPRRPVCAWRGPYSMQLRLPNP